MLTYAEITTRVLQFLQDTGASTYDSTETGFAIENELKRLSRYASRKVDVVFKVESRTGTETAGTSDKLTDTGKSQFVAGDATNEKVIHNITDDTYAVVTGYTSTSVLSISADIMDDGEEYEMYNKRCRNKRQIYIGDMPPYLWIESVEYPVGTERNFFVISRDILKLDVEDFVVKDSDSTLSPLNKTDVLIKFALPQVLCQLTTLVGAVNAIEPVGETTIAVDGLGATETIEIGDEFHIAGFRFTYTVTTGVLLSSGGGNITVYPGMEAATADGDVLTFVKSTLQPNHEDLLERMVISRAVQSDMIRFAKSGAPLLNNFQEWINNNPLLEPRNIQMELEALVTSRTAKVLSRE
ncbi:hypothetical protein LCGC14_2510910 [marine sediment metagenome]|uniref:Uncharacterized protein n=1 Tax=marine sediment metagenome TaxID=412755 RepID=A0A0F9DSN1_9ZZZZ